MKTKWACPICQTILVKEKDADGEGVKKCPKCKASWFLLLCRSPSKEWLEQEGKEDANTQMLSDASEQQDRAGEGTRDQQQGDSVGTRSDQQVSEAQQNHPNLGT